MTARVTAALLALAVAAPSAAFSSAANESLVERFVRTIGVSVGVRPRSFLEERITINRLGDPNDLNEINPGAYFIYMSRNDILYGPIVSQRCDSDGDEKVDCRFERRRGNERAAEAQSFFVRRGKIYRIAINPPIEGVQS